jgi:hypothetical protein
LTIGFILISITLMAQPTSTGPWVEHTSGKIYLDKAHSDHDRGANGGVAGNSAFGAQADWSIDLQIGSWTPNDAASNWTGPSHNGMGAVGVGTFTAGMTNRASGSNAAVFGFHNVAGPLNSEETSYPPSDSDSGGQFAFGYGNQATGNYAFSGGEGTTASGAHSFSFGENTVASGSYSTAIGFETDASDYGSLVIGQYNSSGTSATSATSFSTSNTAFVIGNGVDSSNKSDAFKVMFNGNTTIGGDDLTIGDLSAFSGSFTQRSAIDVVAHSDGDLMTGYINGSTGDRFNIELDASNSLAKISSGGGYDLTFSTEGGTMNFESNGFGTGTYAFNGNTTVSNDLTVSGDVVVSSDARLKSNIVSLGSTLSRLLLIDGKSYEMKGKQKIGVLAQEIKEVFPELVSEDANEMLAVNYQGLVPVLINALKEQDDKISRLENLVEKLISEK